MVLVIQNVCSSAAQWKEGHRLYQRQDYVLIASFIFDLFISEVDRTLFTAFNVFYVYFP